MTASRLDALTLGELRSTSDTSDLDTPARAATVSRVGFRAVRPGGATWPLLGRLWSAPTLWAKRDRVNETYPGVRVSPHAGDGAEGSVTVQHGGLESDPGTWFGHIVPGTGTGGFAGWSGSARIVHDEQGAYFEIELA